MLRYQYLFSRTADMGRSDQPLYLEMLQVQNIRLQQSQGQSLYLCLLVAGAVLGWHVREGGISPETLQRFNAERGPRVREVLTKASHVPDPASPRVLPLTDWVELVVLPTLNARRDLSHLSGFTLSCLLGRAEHALGTFP